MMNVGKPQLAFDFARCPTTAWVWLAWSSSSTTTSASTPRPSSTTQHRQRPEEGRRDRWPAVTPPRAFYVDKLAEGVATIAAAFWPGKSRSSCACRTSSPTSTKKLIGGSRYEPEENPMLGFRGARVTSARNSAKPLPWNAGAQARAQRHGPDQRRNHGALRAHPETSRTRYRHAGRPRPGARLQGGKTTCASS